jgi:release factor glutamine methyltransferase
MSDTLARDKYWVLNEKYNGVETPDFFRDVERLERGEPVAYVIGWIPFLGSHIKLNHRPLIPRPETEFWTDEALKILEAKHSHIQPLNLADLYAGSGCIGVSALRRFPKARVTFVDIGQDECTQVHENILANVYHPNRASVVRGDATTSLGGPYDAIFANPPYIDQASNTTDMSVHTWEPHRALYAPELGLSEIRKLLEVAGTHLKDDGMLFIEFAKDQEVAIANLSAAKNWNIQFRKDQYDVIRWLVASTTLRSGS